MVWDIEYTDEFEEWWDGLDAKEQSSVAASVDLLGLFGPGLRFPHSSDIKGARHGNLRELRVQHAGRPYRVLYAFDFRRCAVLLIGGDKTAQPPLVPRVRTLGREAVRRTFRLIA